MVLKDLGSALVSLAKAALCFALAYAVWYVIR